MGLSEDYILPENYNEAYHLTGDGVVVPVIRHLAQNIICQLPNSISSEVKVDWRIRSMRPRQYSGVRRSID